MTPRVRATIAWWIPAREGASWSDINKAWVVLAEMLNLAESFDRKLRS